MGDFLHELPALSQLVLVFGYIGYRLSCSGPGMRADHTAADITLQSFIFGALSVFFAYLISLFVYLIGLFAYLIGLTDFISFDNVEFWYVALGGIISLRIAVWWAKKGRTLITSVMRKRIDDRFDDGSPSTWVTLLNNRNGWYHIDVYLNNGDILESSFDKIPDDWPHKDGIFSHAGDLAIYVTGTTKNGKYKDTAVLNEGKKHSASTLTFIPASSIKFIDLQLQR